MVRASRQGDNTNGNSDISIVSDVNNSGTVMIMTMTIGVIMIMILVFLLKNIGKKIRK